jgi:hypothetical protein
MKILKFKALLILMVSVIGHALAQKSTDATIMHKYSELRTWKYAYANGASIVVRPDDSVSLIHIRAFSPGGALLFPSSDYATAIHSASIIAKGMEKELVGTHITFQPEITPQFTRLSVTCPQNELEAALKLITLCFTGGEHDVLSEKKFLETVKNEAKTRSADARAVLSDVSTKVAGYPDANSPKAVSSIKVERAYELFRKAFQSAGNFSFVFTGKLKESSAMNTSKLLPLISSYIGALPSDRNIAAEIKAKPNDDHFLAEGTAVLQSKTPKMPLGKVVKTIYAGSGENALISLNYHGTYEYSDSVDSQLQALSGILENQLKADVSLKLEDIHVELNTGKYPSENYALTITFSYAAKAVEKAISETKKTVAAMQEGIDPAMLKQYVDSKKKLLKQQYFDNNFWTDYFEQEMSKNEDPYDLAHYPFYYRKLTPTLLQKTATKFLSGGNYIQLVVLPKK